MCYSRGGDLEERRLFSSTQNQPIGRLSSRVAPLWEFLPRDRVRVLTSIEAADQPRAPNVPTSDIECPADEGAVLVLVERDLVVDGRGNALLSRSHIGTKKVRRVGFAEWDGEGDLGAFGLATEVSVSDRGESDRVIVYAGNETLKVLDHGYSPSVDGRGTAATRWLWGLVRLGGREAGLWQTALEAGRTWAQPGHCVSGFASVDVLACSAGGTANGFGAALDVHRILGAEPGSRCAAACATGCGSNANTWGTVSNGTRAVQRSVCCCRPEENEGGDGEIRWDEEHGVV